MKKESFQNTLEKAAKKSSWVKWVKTDSNAQNTRDFLEMSYSNLTSNEQSRWVKKVGRGDKTEVEATIYELVAVELLRRLNLEPQYEPEINGQTPDIQFSFSKQKFLADVFVTHSPMKTVRKKKKKKREGNVFAMTDEGDRARKVEETLAKKTHKYDGLNLPIVLFVFLGDRYALHIEHIEEALFGYYHTEFKFTKEELLAPRKDDRPYSQGLFLRSIIPDLPDVSKNLSAVVACDWFDTLNRNAPGKRLDCLIIHYWDVICELPVTAFRKFPQIVWIHKGPDIWEWQYTAKDIYVAKLPPVGGIKFGKYTGENPW